MKLEIPEATRKIPGGLLEDYGLLGTKSPHLVAPGLTPSMSQLSLLLRILRMASACSLVKLTPTLEGGRFPPLSHRSMMAE